MRIGVLCATQRGLRFLGKLGELLPDAEFVVVSFKEKPWEPPFLDSIRQLTCQLGGEFLEARDVGNSELKKFWAASEIDLMFLASWRYIVPAEVYSCARRGTFVFHDSFLPEYRGFSPTVWSIINGEDHTGVTVFEIADEFDAGDIVAQLRVPIGDDETIAVMLERVTETYLLLLGQNLQGLLDGTASRAAQDHSAATYVRKRLPEDNEIDWTQSSSDVHNLIRGVAAPYPGAYTHLGGQKLRIWSSSRVVGEPPHADAASGSVVDLRDGEGAIVATGDGVLLAKEVQVDGEERARADTVLTDSGCILGFVSER